MTKLTLEQASKLGYKFEELFNSISDEHSCDWAMLGLETEYFYSRLIDGRVE